MALSKEKKAYILNNLKELIKDASSIAFTTNTGLSVEEITNLRIELREVDASILLAKKTLIKLAFKEVFDVEIPDDYLPRQIAMVISNKDPISGMSKLNNFRKQLEDKIEWSSCFFDWELKGPDDTKVIASMPSRETLLSRLVWSMQSPLSSFARFIDKAAKDMQEKGKEKLWELQNSTPKQSEEVEKWENELKEEEAVK